MLCSSCGSSNPEGNRFCGQCGAQLSQADTLIAPAGPVSTAFRKEVEKQQYQLRQLQRRAEDRGLASETHAMPEQGRRATDRKPEPESTTLVDAEAPGWRTTSPSNEPALQSSRSNFDDETLVGEPHRHTDSYAPFEHETRAVETDALPPAGESEYEEPPISGPSFLGLGHADADDANLAYLYEDESSRPRRARYWVAAIILLACAGFVFYQWKQNWNWDTTIIGRHKAQQADAGKPGGETATTTGNAPESANARPADSNSGAQNGAGAPTAPAVQGDAVTGSTNAATENKNAASPAPGGTSPEQPQAADQSQTADKSQMANAKGTNPNVSADQGSKSSNAADTNAHAPDQNSAAAADQTASPDEAESGADEVADAAPPKSSKSVPAKPATSRYAEKEPGSELVAKADKYLYGRGVSKNCDQALVYLHTAANRGNAEARSKLGGLYATGHCVSMDRAEAYNWFTLARDAGSKNVWVERNREMLWSQMTPAEKERTLGP